MDQSDYRYLHDDLSSHVRSLSARTGRRSLRRTLYPDYEREEIVQHLHDLLDDLSNLRIDTCVVQAKLERARKTLGDARDVDSIQQFLERVRYIQIEQADAVTLYVLLKQESCREAPSERLSRVSSRESLVQWSDIHEDSPLGVLASDGSLDEPRPYRSLLRGRRLESQSKIRKRLLALHKRRRDQYQLMRVRLRTRALYLMFVTVMLILVLTPFAILVGFALSGPVSPLLSIWLSVLAGALGAIASGVFRLRDATIRMNEFRLVAPTLLLQPVIGAMSGVLALLIQVAANSGPASSLLFVLFCFLAGFSEQFFLRALGQSIPDPEVRTGSSR